VFDGLGTTETTEDLTEFNRLFAETAGMYRCTEIRRHVERHFQLEPGALLIRSRKWNISHRRQLAMALCYKHFRGRVSYESVARQFGGLHYSTAIFACQKFGLEPDPIKSERGRRARTFRADAQIRSFAVAA
jgi:chromosomal replication initiation ATPase DnaA